MWSLTVGDAKQILKAFHLSGLQFLQRSVVLLVRDGVDLSQYRIAYHVDLQNTPAWFELRRPRTETSRSHTSNILPERLPGRVCCTKSQSSLLNIYFHISGFSSYSFTLSLVYHKQWNKNLFRYATIQFRDRRGAASLLYRNHACQNRLSYVWTNALSDVVFVPARELSSSRHSLNFILCGGNALILFCSPGANYEVEFGLFMLLLRRMLSVFLVSRCSQSPYFARFPCSFSDHRPCTRFYK